MSLRSPEDRPLPCTFQGFRSKRARVSNVHMYAGSLLRAHSVPGLRVAIGTSATARSPPHPIEEAPGPYPEGSTTARHVRPSLLAVRVRQSSARPPTATVQVNDGAGARGSLFSRVGRTSAGGRSPALFRVTPLRES